jgi:ammonium transporter Rh
MSTATYVLGAVQVVLLIFLGTMATSDPHTSMGHGGSVTQAYNMFIGVEIMMFVGFGYLMTCLKTYGLGAVGFTMMVTAIALQWAVFEEAFWYQLWDNKFKAVQFDIYSLLQALYAISCVLITFGALIGKITPLQMIVLTLIELPLHGLNYKILMDGVMKNMDIGGTYIDHMFGAYFGLAVAWVLGKAKTTQKEGYIPDMFSFVGTLFLWIYWPSFVAGAATADSDEQGRAIVNTILSLSGSTVATFVFSAYVNPEKKWRPVDIQNATLAGGVGIGSIANLGISPFGAVATGVVSGIVSTLGFNFIQGWLENTLGVHDTCGIHNLHAMPAVIGAIASVIVQAHEGTSMHTDPSQWWFQLVAMILCIAYSIVTGLITGFILKTMEPANNVKEFHDHEWWEVGHDFWHPHLAGNAEGQESEVELIEKDSV